MKFRDRLGREFAQIDSDLRNTPIFVLIVISCLALVLASTIAFGGLHL